MLCCMIIITHGVMHDVVWLNSFTLLTIQSKVHSVMHVILIILSLVIIGLPLIGLHKNLMVSFHKFTYKCYTCYT